MAFEMVLGLDGKSNIIYLAIGSFILISSFVNKCISKINEPLTQIQGLCQMVVIIGIQNTGICKLCNTDDGSSNSTLPTKLRFNYISE